MSAQNHSDNSFLLGNDIESTDNDVIVLVKEIVLKNGQQTYFICSLCKKVFSSIANLTRHKISHSDPDHPILFLNKAGKHQDNKGQQKKDLACEKQNEKVVSPPKTGKHPNKKGQQKKRIALEKPNEKVVSPLKPGKHRDNKGQQKKGIAREKLNEKIVSPLKPDKHRDNKGRQKKVLAYKKRNEKVVKPYSCEFCTESFSQRLQFLKHLCEHTGETFVDFPLDDVEEYQHTDETFGDFPLDDVEEYQQTDESPDVLPLDAVKFQDRPQQKIVRGKTNQNRKVLSCGPCSKSFDCRSDLLKHLGEHRRPDLGLTDKVDQPQKKVRRVPRKAKTNRKLYSCDSCSEKFHKKSEILKHVRVHNIKKPKVEVEEDYYQQENNDCVDKQYTCAFCPNSYSERTQLLNHLPLHSKTKYRKIKKENEDYQPQVKKRRGRRKRIVLPEVHPCDFCSESFDHQPALMRHLCEHTGEKPHPCEFCDEFFIDKKALKRHYQVHAVVEPYPSSDGKESGKYHNTYPCRYCDKTFVQLVHLRTHFRTHTGERPYSCQHCDKSFSQKSVLTRHYLIHTKAQPYVCLDCGKTFSLSSNFARHALVHSGVRPFSCEICYKSFAQKVNLTNHSYVHTGIRPYSCSECGKAFIKKRNLVRHLLVHVKFHKLEPAPF